MGSFVSNSFGSFSSGSSNQGRDQLISAGKEKRAGDKAAKRQKKVDALQQEAAGSQTSEQDKKKKRIIGANASISSDQGRLGAPNIGRRRLSI